MEIIPPDLSRCQAEKPNGHNFMILGGHLGGRERCTDKPAVIIVELVAGNDGKHGCMSLCSDCFKAFQKQCPDAKVTIWHRHATPSHIKLCKVQVTCCFPLYSNYYLKDHIQILENNNNNNTTNLCEYGIVSCSPLHWEKIVHSCSGPSEYRLYNEGHYKPLYAQDDPLVKKLNEKDCFRCSSYGQVHPYCGFPGNFFFHETGWIAKADIPHTCEKHELLLTREK